MALGPQPVLITSRTALATALGSFGGWVAAAASAGRPPASDLPVCGERPPLEPASCRALQTPWMALQHRTAS